MSLPPRTLWLGLAAVTALAWLLTRVVLAVAGGTDLSPSTSVMIAALAGWLGVYDLRLAGERAFLDNLGIRPTSYFLFTFSIAAALEFGIGLLM